MTEEQRRIEAAEKKRIAEEKRLKDERVIQVEDLAKELKSKEYEGLSSKEMMDFLHTRPVNETTGEIGNSPLELKFQKINGMPNVIPDEMFEEALKKSGR